MTTNKLATKIVLDDNPELFGQMLALMQGAFSERDVMPTPYEVCREKGMSYGAFLAWVNEDEERIGRFTEAMKLRAMLLHEEAMVIADECGDKDDVPVAKLRGDRRVQAARAWNPERFSEKLQVAHNIVPEFRIEIVRDEPKVIEGEVLGEDEVL